MVTPPFNILLDTETQPKAAASPRWLCFVQRHNPDGSQTPGLAKGIGATKFALQSLAITVALAALGFYFQFK